MLLFNDLLFQPECLAENILFLNDFFSERNMSWTFVIKAFSHYPENFISELCKLPVASMASDKLTHLNKIKESNPIIETWFLNYQGEVLNDEAVDVNFTHSNNSVDDKTCLLLAVDPERFGAEYSEDFNCRKLGAYLDCAKMPEKSFFETWKKFNFPDTILQSLGTSVSFEQVDFLQSMGVNHYRIGELALTGKNLVSGEKIKGLRQDVFISKQSLNYYTISNIFNSDHAGN